jgi:hypothetical protein
MSKVFNTIVNAYIEAFYFADTGEDGQPNNDAELAESTLNSIKNDVEIFLSYAPMNKINGLGDWTWDLVGHDLYFTRQGHGVGFWDKPDTYGSKLVAEQLTRIAEHLGQVDYYQGDDGLIYN